MAAIVKEPYPKRCLQTIRLQSSDLDDTYFPPAAPLYGGLSKSPDHDIICSEQVLMFHNRADEKEAQKQQLMMLGENITPDMHLGSVLFHLLPKIQESLAEIENEKHALRAQNCVDVEKARLHIQQLESNLDALRKLVLQMKIIPQPRQPQQQQQQQQTDQVSSDCLHHYNDNSNDKITTTHT
jgi:hypothetical protein